MNNNRQFIPIALAALISVGCSRNSDSAITKTLLGRWGMIETKSDAVEDYHQMWLFPGGRANWSYVHIDLRRGSREWDASGTWEVLHGYLHYRIETSSNSAVLPNGWASADRILRVTKESLALVDSRTGDTQTWLRLEDSE